MDDELVRKIKMECDIKCQDILRYADRSKEYKLFKLNLCILLIETEFQSFKESIIEKYGLNNDKNSIRILHSAIMHGAKSCINIMMGFKN